MFCMNCGQQLPDGAKFCMKCGTPQGAVSPARTTQAETINLDGTHSFVPAMCPNCNAHMKVDSSSKIARCETCGTECLVQDAIKALTVRGNVQVGNATINVNGSNTESLLQRVAIMLADGDFDGAMTKCDSILDSDPTNGNVYLYLLLSNLHCKQKSELAYQRAPFDGNQYYINAMKYGDTSLKNELQGYLNSIIARLEPTQRNPQLGDEIYFGTLNGRRLWWKVINLLDQRRAFMITSDSIGDMPYHQPGRAITWNECTLRAWLNNNFFNECFSDAEKAKILTCKLVNERNPQYKAYSHGTETTYDKVFLPSVSEVQFCFKNYQDGAIGSWWWLRTQGEYQNMAAGVFNDGGLNLRGIEVQNYQSVRPAMMITLD